MALDRLRAASLLQAAGPDALVLFQPEAFRYAVGAPGGVATMWRRGGAAIALVPADAGAPMTAIVSDHAAPGIRRRAPDIDLRSHRVWIDAVDLSALDPDQPTAAQVSAAYRDQALPARRPESFDREAFGLLGEVLAERGLATARIGVDLEFLPAADFEALKRALPTVRWEDGSEILRRLRAIKSSREISYLRQGSQAADAGIVRLTERVAAGVSLRELSEAWQEGAEAAAGPDGMTGHWDFISVGPDPTALDAVVEAGALIKADVGCLVEGYSSDGARTFSFGRPSAAALDIFKALETAFHAGLDALRPGSSFGAVHAAMIASMRRDGFGGYFRGHFGHGLGASVGSEEWPFISADNPEIIEPGMVLAIETPFYGKGVGALMIEDQLLVTPTGIEVMNTLPRELRDLS